MLVTSLDTKSVFAKSGEDEGKCLTVECDSRETSGLRRSRRWPNSDHEIAGLLAFLDIFLIDKKSFCTILKVQEINRKSGAEKHY